ncbi:MAG: ABC transporter ATP-binding protein [Eggerthellaceae bacterium]
MTHYAFETRKLTVGYDGKPLIEGIEIAIEPGQVMTLIGPNGAGKSTILKSISKQLQIVDGTVLVEGRDLTGISASELAKTVSMLFSTAPATELLTCQDIVETGRYPYTGRMGVLNAEDHARVDQIMKTTQVWEIRDRDFSRISDGQRQRVLLARALCQEPKILIMDEPTSFLDIRYQIELLGLVRKLATEQGLCVIMSLHELDMAQRLSDVVLAIKDNAVFRYGDPEDIFTRETIGELYGIDLSEYKPLFS